MRIAGIILAVLIILTGMTALALYNLDNIINNNKEYIVEQIEDATGRKAEVDTIGLNIFGGLGIQLTDFKLRDDPRFSENHFVSASRLIVNVEFFPLLRKQLAVKKVILSNPYISIIKNKNGVYNFESVARSGEEQDPQQEDENGEQGKQFSIALVEISNGEISYNDEQNATSLRLKKVDVSSGNIGTDKPINIESSLALLSEQQNVHFSAKAGPLDSGYSFEDTPISGNITITSLNTDELQRNFPDLEKLLPYEPGLSGPLDLKLEFDGRSTALTISSIDLSAGVFGSGQQNFHINGSMGPFGRGFTTDNLKVSLDFELGPVMFEKIREFEPLTGSFPKELKGSGPVSVSGSVKGDFSSPALNSMELNGSNAELKYGDLFHKPSDLEFIINADADISPGTFTIKNSETTLGGLVLDTKGTIKIGGATVVDLKLQSNKAGLGEIANSFPIAKQYSPSGKFQIETEITGRYGPDEFPDIRGTAMLEDAGISLPQLAKPLKEINSVINFTGTNANIEETTALMGDSTVRISADVSQFSPLSVRYKISSPAVYLSDVTTEREGELKDINIEGTMRNVSGTASLNADIESQSGSISGIRYSDMNGKINLENQIVNFEDIVFRFLNGSMKANGYYDMSSETPGFNVNTSIQGLNITDLVKTVLSPSSEHIKGKSNISINLSGKGNSWDQISNTLNGLGNIELTEGELVDFNLAQEVLTGLTGIQGLSGLISSQIENKYPEVFKTTSTVFYDMNVPVKIVNGRINFDELILRSSDYIAKGKGWLALNKNIQANGYLTLAEELSNDLTSRVELVKYLNDDRGRVRIPFRVDGSVPGVRPSPDLSTVAEIFRNAAVDRGKEEVKKRVLDELKQDNDKQQGEGTEGSPDEEIKEKLKKFIPFPSSGSSESDNAEGNPDQNGQIR